MHMKKFLAFLMTLCLLMGMAPVQALAGGESYYISWFINDEYVYGENIYVSFSHELMAEYGERVTVTPKSGFKITDLQYFLPDDTNALQGQQSGRNWSFTMPDVGVDIMVTVEAENGGALKHRVTVQSAGGGNPVADKAAAAEGETITITLNPDEGNVLDRMQVEYQNNGQEAYLFPEGNSFAMPDSDVVVTVYYKMGSGGSNPPPAQPHATISFDPNGGSCATQSAPVNSQNKLASLPTPTYSNHFFVGWFLASGEKVTQNTEFAEDTTVQARWVSAMHITKPEDNAYSSDIALDDQAVLGKLLTDDDLESTENIYVWLEAEEIEQTEVPADEKAAISAKAAEDTIAAYLDINLFKRIGNGEKTKIHSIDSKIPITMQLTDAVIPENAQANSFYIVYYHGGAAHKTSAFFAPATKTLTFEANEFSTYSLVYKTSTDSYVPQASVPRTGDESELVLWSVLAMMSLLGMAALVRRRTKA